MNNPTFKFSLRTLRRYALSSTYTMSWHWLFGIHVFNGLRSVSLTFAKHGNGHKTNLLGRGKLRRATRFENPSRARKRSYCLKKKIILGTRSLGPIGRFVPRYIISHFSPCIFLFARRTDQITIINGTRSPSVGALPRRRRGEHMVRPETERAHASTM